VKYTRETVYDGNGHYLPVFHEEDPAYPGITPEPQEMAVVFAGMDPIPVAKSFLRDAEPRHYDQIRQMLRELPERRLTQIVGYGDTDAGDWRAFNGGDDGHGDWTIIREPARPKPVVRKTPPQPLDLSQPSELVRIYNPSWGAQGVNYDEVWTCRLDGRRISAERMRTQAIIAGWRQMRQIAPHEQWSTELCDAIVEAALRTVRDWVEAP
jgi:hypothetical protein